MARKIAIFGSGLSAAFICAAAKEWGIGIDIYTDRPFTLDLPELGHVILKWIPGNLKMQPIPISHFAMGDRYSYLKRMGREKDPETKTTFPETGRNEFLAYNPKQALKELWPQDARMTYGKFSDKEIEAISKEHAWTFVTFPLQQSKAVNKLVFYQGYTLENQNFALPNMAIYNGTTNFPWTRFTQYWNIMSWEYSHLEYPPEALPPRPNAWAEPKKIADIAVGVPEYFSPYEGVTMVGRWARWRKDVLSHDGYAQASNIFNKLYWTRS
jgi:hypothetical protein